MIPHRGPTHSIVLAFLLLLPIFYYRRTQAYIYYVAYASHLVSDLVAGGYYSRSKLLWPLSDQWVMIHPKLIMGSREEAIFEIFLLCSALIVIWMTKDFKPLLEYDDSNFLLFFPCGTVLASFFFILYHIINLTNVEQ